MSDSSSIGDRDKAIVDAYRSGKTQTEIGESIGVSRQRIQQILKRNGVSRCDGGAHVVSITSKKERQSAKRKRREEEARRLGISYREYMSFYRRYKRRDPKNPINAYRQQKRNSEWRGIPWEFKNFAEWWAVWKSSGKWGQRGRSAELFVMARPNDLGPYSPSNVEIVTFSENCSDARKRWSRKNAAGH